jgi:hypothetical protein
MKFAALVLTATAMLLGGCAAQRAARDDSKCQGYGFKPGSEGYAQCRMTRDVERQRRLDSPSTCTTTINAGIAQTNCY